MVQARIGWVRMAIAGIGIALLMSAGVWSSVRAQTAIEVPIQAFVYQPATITVPAGTTVTWTNLDPVAHTVTDIDGTYDSGLFEESGVYALTFTTPGTYVYYCIPHPIMIGTIEVTP